MFKFALGVAVGLLVARTAMPAIVLKKLKDFA